MSPHLNSVCSGDCASTVMVLYCKMSFPSQREASSVTVDHSDRIQFSALTFDITRTVLKDS